MFKAHDAILAVDIGGSNIRAGIVNLNIKKKSDLSKAVVWKYELWRHADENDVKREDAIDNLVGMLKRLITRAQKDKIELAPFIGIGCPGKIEAGRLDRSRRTEPAGRQLGIQPFQSADARCMRRSRRSVTMIPPSCCIMTRSCRA